MIKKNNVFFNWSISLILFSSVLSGCGTDCNTQNECQLKGTQLLSEKDYSHAIKYFEKGCELGMGRSCYFVGLLRNSGELGKEDKDSALGFYEKSCDFGIALGCTSAGLIYEKIELGRSFALDYYRKGCELKDFRSCYLLATTNLSEKDPIKDNISIDLKYLDQACHIEFTQADEIIVNNLLPSLRQADICWQAGSLNLLLRNELQAIKSYIKSCDQKNEEACEGLGKVLVNSGENTNEIFSNIRTFFNNKCRVAQDKQACIFLGDWVSSIKIENSSSVARELYGLACEYGDAKTCYKLGRDYSYSNNDKEAIRYYELGCLAKHPDSCTAAGELSFGSKKMAAEFYQKGCALGDKVACSRCKLLSDDCD